MHRSEEVAPEEVRHLVRQASSVSSDGEGSLSGDSATWQLPSLRLAADGEFAKFVDKLGPGQLVGRQALASPCLGELQVSLCDRRTHLEVEVIRAKGLQPKPGAKMLPGTCAGSAAYSRSTSGWRKIPSRWFSGRIVRAGGRPI